MVADFWGVSVQHVRNLVNKGELACVRIGKEIRIRASDVYEYEERACQGSQKATISGLTQAQAFGTSGGPKAGNQNAFQLGQRIAAMRKSS